MAESMKACFAIDAYTEHEDNLITRPHKTYQIRLSKDPKDLLRLKPSLLKDQNLYVICMIRDPRDIVVSKHGKDSNKYWVGLNKWKRNIKIFNDLAGHDRFIPIRYEDLVRNPDKIQEIIIDRMPFLEVEDHFSNFGKLSSVVADKSVDALGGVRPISGTSIGKWQDHKARLLGQIIKHGNIQDDLVRFGYEYNNDWLKELSDIVPDFSNSSWAESWPNINLEYEFRKYLEPYRRLLEKKIGRSIRREKYFK